MTLETVVNKNGEAIPVPIERALRKKVNDLVASKNVDVSEEYMGENGLIHLENAGLVAFSSAKTANDVPVGSYVKLGEAIGRYGFTAKKDIRTH